VNTYGADGLRTTAQISGQPYNFIYDYDGSVIGHENFNSPAGQNQELWIGGKHYGYFTTAQTGSSAVPYLVNTATDWVGTDRMHNDRAGNQIVTFCSLPFGDQVQNCVVSPTNTGPSDATFFTGKERDSVPDDGNGVSGIDYFGARYYASSMGRFLTPDWSAQAEPVPYAKLDNPQSLNLYAYVSNNPTSDTDPDGHLLSGGPGICEANAAGNGCSTGQNDRYQTFAQTVTAQQQFGDPTLPTEVQTRSSVADDVVSALMNPTVMNVAFLVGTDGLGGIAEAGVGLEAGETLLTRYGTKVESTLEKLSGDAAKAEEKIGVHGVSATAKPNPKLPGGTAAKSTVESAFKVTKTGGPNHFTIVLPKPVTDAIVQIFNSLFWP